ncbi:MAG: YHS domain-containing protein [Sedimentisphaerales bacterium]|nr:YHS domain-containing protein [Sedimentisphaerales bacterium]
MRAKLNSIRAFGVVSSIVVASLLAASGCGQDEQPTTQESQSEQVMGRSEQMAANASDTAMAAIEQKTCPVMAGNPINPNIFVEYEGKKVYFCCAGCPEKFKADPEKYLSKLPQFQQ